MSTTTRASQPTRRDTAVSRRTLARGLAWTAPLAIVGVAAPAFAASDPPCEPNKASYRTDTTPGSPTYSSVTKLIFVPSMVTADVEYFAKNADGSPRADATPGETGWVHSTDFDSPATPDWDYIKLHLPKPPAKGEEITMVITLSQPVQNLHLTITDIDGYEGSWIDEVIVTPGAVPVLGANVIGSGTTVDPFRSQVDGGIDSPLGDLDLTWPGPLNKVQVTYRAGDEQGNSDIGQHIGIGQISYGC